MTSRSSRWVSGIGAILVSGGLLIASYGSGVTPAAATQPASASPNPTLRWDTNHPSASRFTTAFPGAVLDTNTGLVWEQAPDATTDYKDWSTATKFCANKRVPSVGGTIGWRLPSVIELQSVQDPSLSVPFVPASVFTGVQPASYWSATTLAADPTLAWLVKFNFGIATPDNKSLPVFAWCVRGPMQESAY